MKSFCLKLLRVLMLLLVLLAGGLLWVFYDWTLTPFWIPLGVAVAAVLLTLPLYGRWCWLTTTDHRVLNALCHTVCVSLFVGSLFLFVNYHLADPSSSREVTVIVLKKQIKEYKKSRRVGRRHYIPDGVRREYYLHVSFPDGKTETLHVSRATYNKAREGKPRQLLLQTGCFGLPVIKKGI